MAILETIHSPADVKDLDEGLLQVLVQELRDRIVAATSVNGGHVASSLGAVELILAAYRVLDLPEDKLLFDVGHQAYVHKMLTGRLDGFEHLRHRGGTSGFTRRKESPYDVHDSGHASDALPTAAGLARAREIEGGTQRIVTIVGDASIVGGLSLEALNYVGQAQSKRFVVILNDNEMSISRPVGAISMYLAGIRTSPRYNLVRDQVEDNLSKTGRVGDALVKLGERAKQATKRFLIPGMFFEELGFTYLGPIDGHSISDVQDTLARAVNMDRPVIIHAVTRKGKGFLPAEKNPELFHGIGPFDPVTGIQLKKPSPVPSYTKVFGDFLVKEASTNDRVVAITAAMSEGTGLKAFQRAFPDRFFDVGIAEELGVAMAGGLAIGGMVPVVAIYSTFLQRAYDELCINVCLPNLHVVFAVDRAGIVGEDGSTHNGMLDLSYLRSLPNMRVVAPSDERELVRAMRRAIDLEGPVAVRYPRGTAEGAPVPEEATPLPMGARVAYQSGFGPISSTDEIATPDAAEASVTILAVGRMVSQAVGAARTLEDEGVTCRVFDMRWVKPVDAGAVAKACESSLVMTVEEGTTSGGFGSAVLESAADSGLMVPFVRLGIPDEFVGHGTAAELLADYGLDAASIARTIHAKLATMTTKPR